jgi:hypothetical protein
MTIYDSGTPNCVMTRKCSSRSIMMPSDTGAGDVITAGGALRWCDESGSESPVSSAADAHASYAAYTHASSASHNMHRHTI